VNSASGSLDRKRIEASASGRLPCLRLERLANLPRFAAFHRRS